jgi:aminoglycoside phosphotransferase (APT) family kinase protein
VGDDAVIKLDRPGFGGHRAEAEALAALDFRGVAPRLIDVVECDGRIGLVLERLDGSDMLALLQREPWRIRSLARPSGDRLCHGDYHPGNVLVAAGRITVIDWAGAARCVPEADHARTLLLLRWADPLPDTPLISRGLISAGRAIFTYEYTRAYAGRSNTPLRQVNQWLFVHVAARLSEGTDVERPRLTEILDRARREAAR